MHNMLNGAELYKMSPFTRQPLMNAYRFNGLSGSGYQAAHLHGPMMMQAGILLNNTKYTQPALFIFLCARLWMSWGIQPSILRTQYWRIRCCTFSRCFTLEDGLKLIATRGRSADYQKEAC
ncbi:hypothetical protein CS542_10060 [Pedobacter sp. IW39]|nr:hypothetical protein CS542_10060 [Pedobacter sp. IW39]